MVILLLLLLLLLRWRTVKRCDRVHVDGLRVAGVVMEVRRQIILLRRDCRNDFDRFLIIVQVGRVYYVWLLLMVNLLLMLLLLLNMVGVKVRRWLVVHLSD